MFVFPYGYRKVKIAWEGNDKCTMLFLLKMRFQSKYPECTASDVYRCVFTSYTNVDLLRVNLNQIATHWRYPDHRRDLGPETWQNVHWQIEKATVLGEGYLRLRITVLHDRLIYKYTSDSKVGFFFMLTFCPTHTYTINYTEWSHVY